MVTSVLEKPERKANTGKRGVGDKADNFSASGGWGWNWRLPKIWAQTSRLFCLEPTSAHTSPSPQMARRLKREHSCLNLCKRKESWLPPWRRIRTSCNCGISDNFKSSVEFSVLANYVKPDAVVTSKYIIFTLCCVKRWLAATGLHSCQNSPAKEPVGFRALLCMLML